MPISLILTPFDHFQNMSSGGIGPDLILTLCHTQYIPGFRISSEEGEELGVGHVGHGEHVGLLQQLLLASVLSPTLSLQKNQWR